MASSQKQQPKQQLSKPQKATKNLSFSSKDLLPGILISLFLIVDFLPGFESVDVMGAQWLYLVIVNIITCIFIIWTKNQGFYEGLFNISKRSVTIVYTALFAWAGISILFALNHIEGMVGYSRFTATFIMYLNIAVLLYNRPQLLKFFIHLIAAILLLRSIIIIVNFSSNLGSVTLDALVNAQLGNTGNKNIMAASFIARIPFVIYGIYLFKSWGRVINIIALFLAVIVIFILNARTTYIGLVLEILVYITGAVVLAFQDNSKKQLIPRLLYVLGPVILAFFLSQFILTNAEKLQDQESTYGNVTQRLATIGFNAESSGNRTIMWGYAMDYIRHHPLMGCGISNWKLASIPYERETSTEFYVAYHCHDDFFEITAELGLPGGIMYISLFIIALSFTILTLRSSANSTIKLMSVISLMALAGYFSDASFNFPMERPIMQFFFAFILAFNLNIYLLTRKAGINQRQKPSIKILYALITFCTLLPALYITYQTYQSMVVQGRVNDDLSNPNPVFTSEEANKLPAIPNLNVFTYPIDAIKARYYVQEKKYDSAMYNINKSAKVNPYLPYNEFLKSAVYTEIGKWDSALYFAKKAFYTKPRATSPYSLLNFICLKLNDTTSIRNAYKEMSKYPNNYVQYNSYFSTMLQIPHDKQQLLALCDSIIKLYPDHSKELQQRRTEIMGSSDIHPSIPSTQQPAAINAGNDFSAKAANAFNKKDFKTAAGYFLKAAELKPGDFADIENAAMCYYSLNDFKTALPLYGKVIASNSIQTGKSEFFKGICLENLGKKEEGCIFLHKAEAKNYPDAKTYLNIYCK